MSRAAALVADVPPATRSIVVLCVAVYATQFLLDPPLVHYTLCPRNVLYLHEYYRLVTSALCHGGPMHLGMNMMAVYGLGSRLERNYGTWWQCGTILWGIMLTGTLYVSVAALVWYGPFFFLLEEEAEHLMYQHSVGFSGVIFQLSVLEANLGGGGGSTRSVFGFFRVPARAYPWVLLVALQMLLPNLSFLGHVSGILVGTAQVHGLLRTVMPSSGFLRETERWEGMARVVGTSGFVKTPDDAVSSPPGAARSSSIPQLLRTGCTLFGKFVRDVAETLRVCVFGHNNNNNNGRGVHALVPDNDDEEWEVRPTIRSTSNVSQSRLV